LEELINHELLLQEAKNRGFDRDRAFLERVERFKERSLLERLRIEEVDTLVKVTMEEMKAYYAANAATFTVPGEFRASHILVKTQEEAFDLKKRLAQGRTSRRWPGRSHWISTQGTRRRPRVHQEGPDDAAI